MTLALILTLASFGVYSELQFRDFSSALDAQIATYSRHRWDRPALRGPGSEGNAAAEVAGLLQGFAGLSAPQREGFASQLYYGQPFSPEQNAQLDQQAPWLAKLRSATWLTWSASESQLGKRGAAPVAFPKAMDAAILMLGQAARANPDECLAICTDTIRFGQDLVPGASLEAVSVSMRITSLTSRVMPFCALRASLDAVARSARELRVLAANPPPSGGGIELADLRAGEKLRDLAQLFTDDDSVTLITRLKRRPALFAAWHYFENPARWRELSPQRYPQVLETWQHEQEWRSRSDLALVGDATAQVTDWLYEDMRGQALIRALTIAMATKAERMRRQRAPREPMLMQDPVLFDPYNGQPMKWRILPDGSELTVWSVGEDLRDDKGSGDWTAQAPIDVVVHAGLKLPREIDTARAVAD